MQKKYLLQLFKKAGVEITPEIKTLLDAAQDNDPVTIPEAVQSSLVAGVLSEADAQTHPNVLKHFKGTLYGKTDAAARAALLDAEFSEAEADALLNGKSADEKITAAAKAIKEKTGKSTKDTKTDIEKTLTESLNKERADRAKDKADYEKNLADKEAALTGYKQDVKLDKFLTEKYKLKTGFGLDKTLRLIKEDLAAEAKKYGGQISINENGELVIINAKEAGADFYVNSVKTDLAGFTANVLKANNYLDETPDVGPKTTEIASNSNPDLSRSAGSFSANFGAIAAAAQNSATV